jgi:hypothetical protein
MRVRLIEQPEPHVISHDGVSIPIPAQIHPPTGAPFRITPNAQIDVVPYRGDRYLVQISVPSWSGDTRMVIAATGTGVGGGAGSRAIERTGFPLFDRAMSGVCSTATVRRLAWGVRWLVSRPAAVVGGMIAPNESATEMHFSQNLADGTRVDYVVLYIPNIMRTGSDRR